EIVEVNNALVNMLGFSSEDELKKINLKDYPYHYTDERIKFKEEMAENGIVKNRYTIWKTMNGDLVHIRENSIEVTDPFTGKIYYEGTVEDITDRLVSNEKLLEESVKFEQLFENNPLGVLLIDPASKIVKANNFFLTLINQPSDFFKINELKFKEIPGFNSGNLNKFVNDVLLGETLKIEEIIHQNNGLDKVFIVYGVPIKITEGISGAYLIFLDISGIRAFEKELLESKVKAEEMSKLKSSFLANMNHELRTPMNGILGFATLLKEELSHDALKKDMAERIIMSGMRLLETLDSIIDLSKLEASNYTLEMRELDLNWSLAEVVALFYDSAKLKSLELILDLPTDPVICVADDRIFKKIIKNLLSNAIKFTFTGQVTISLRKVLHDNSNFAEILIKDTGIGIESNKKEVIFEAFRQGSEGLSRMFEGSGVGLTVTKRLVELLNGKLIFESEPGSGSSFSVLIPYLDELEKAVAPKTEIEEISINSIERIPEKRIEHSKKRIIYVEDDSVNRDLVAYFLSGRYELDFASDGTSGLIKLNLKDYDLVLMDIHLGNGPSGEHVLKSIRENNKTAKLPVIALTAYVMPGNKQRYLSLGFNGYIPKPFKRELLVETVDRFINAK
ncbi:MAG: response regulator, partial [Ignavibacteriaceae bacterium]|nr:response regulator [Ignavibacteriaceae bacterium]